MKKFDKNPYCLNTKMLIIVAFLLHLVVNINLSYTENINIFARDPSASNPPFTGTSSFNTYDSSGNPCTISTTPNCGLYMAVYATGPNNSTTAYAFYMPCSTPQISSACYFKPMTYDGASFFMYGASNNPVASGNTQYDLGSIAYSLITTPPSQSTYSVSTNGISISGLSEARHVTQTPTYTTSIDNALFDGYNMNSMNMSVTIQTSSNTTSVLQIPSSLIYPSSTTTQTSNTTSSSSSASSSRDKKACIMRLRTS